MKLNKIFDQVLQYFSEAVARIFGPSDDAYPVVGTQPYSGDPFRGDADEW
jgi:hypothetical protein